MTNDFTSVEYQNESDFEEENDDSLIETILDEGVTYDQTKY